MKAADVVDRARSAVGQGCRYVLGKGGFSPAAPHPWSSQGDCDCSGFVSWCLGISRHTDNPWYASYNGGWVETTAIVRDASGPYGFFDAVDWKAAAPGMLIVYGDHVVDGVRRQGHVGIVSAVDQTGPFRAVHCSKGNDTKTGDAIRETDVQVWIKGGGIVARCALVE